jgi:cell division transport system ATP-binding protein
MIEFEEVSKTYGRAGRIPAALNRITFRVEEGEFALLMGPSGAGKSTLLKLILAMESPDCGHIRVAGRDVHRLTRASIPFLRRNLGAVFQDFKLIEEATPSENVGLALHVLGMRPREVKHRVALALERVGLDAECKKPVRQLSGGEQQRVALARALAGDPPVLLADEPTGNLDPKLTLEIVQCLEQIREQGTTILLATHDPIVRDQLRGSRLLYLENGHLKHDIVEDRERSTTGEEEAVELLEEAVA